METSISLPFITMDATGPKHLEMKLTRAKFNDLTRHLVEATQGPTKTALQDANLNASQIDEILLVGGSYGMAGAISLNITGAKAMGFPYIEVGCIDGIYPIVATKHTTPVFHPFSAHNVEQQLASTIEHVSAAAFGSGVTQMFEKELCSWSDDSKMSCSFDIRCWRHTHVAI